MMIMKLLNCSRNVVIFLTLTVTCLSSCTDPSRITSSNLATSALRITKVIYVAPVDGKGNPMTSLTVSTVVRGSCEDGSDVVSLKVYRCFFANYVADPCWAVTDQKPPLKSALCMEQPWAKTIVRVDTQGLPSGNTSEPINLDFPWGVQLTTGLKCLALQGAHDIYAGQTVNYSCGHSGTSLLGRIDRTGSLWSFESADWNGTNYVLGTTVHVEVAWYAKQ